MAAVEPPFEPPLPEPPGPPGAASLRFFKCLNRWFMVPAHRAGLGAWLSTPFGGYILLLRVRGRRTGLIRETPLNYLVAEGAAWVLAGYGPRSEWYRNLLVNPQVEVRLPGRRLRCTATEVRSPAARARILPPLLRSTPFPALGAGLNAWTATDEHIVSELAWVPLLRLDPQEGPLEAGPDDPGGSAWVWRQALVVGVSLLAIRQLRSALRRGAPRGSAIIGRSVGDGRGGGRRDGRGGGGCGRCEGCEGC